MKAKYVKWYVLRLEEETRRTETLFARFLNTRTLTEDELYNLADSDRKIRSYIKLLGEYVHDAEQGFFRRFF
jgi:hypothetical protein